MAASTAGIDENEEITSLSIYVYIEELQCLVIQINCTLRIYDISMTKINN